MIPGSLESGALDAESSPPPQVVAVAEPVPARLAREVVGLRHTVATQAEEFHGLRAEVMALIARVKDLEAALQ